MLEYFNFLAMFRKRRRFNGDDGNGDNSGNNYSLFNNLIGSCNFLFGVSSNDFDSSQEIQVMQMSLLLTSRIQAVILAYVLIWFSI